MKGDGITYPSIIEKRKKYTRQGLKEYISVGRGVMPAFDFISDSQKEELVTFVFNPEARTIDVASLDAISEELEEIPYSHTGYTSYRNGKLWWTGCYKGRFSFYWCHQRRETQSI